jgi:hypothetical protein
MNDFQTPENSSIVPQQLGESISLDDFKSIFYQLNAKPDTEIRLLRGKKNLELADITSINERISAKLSNHDVTADIASINFVLSNRKIKDYFTWAEFERENWETVEIIRYSSPIILLLVSYQYSDYWLPAIGIEEKISPKNLEALLISFAAFFMGGIFLGFKFERFIDERIDKFEEYPRFSITRGDRKAVEEFEKTNNKLTNQILIRFFWVLFALAVSSSVKLVGSYLVQ